jgi:hypothetical protein
MKRRSEMWMWEVKGKQILLVVAEMELSNFSATDLDLSNRALDSPAADEHLLVMFRMERNSDGVMDVRLRFISYCQMRDKQ